MTQNAKLVVLLPTGKKVNPATAVTEGLVTEGMTLYVTENEAGRIRTLVSSSLKLKVGETFEAVHATRKLSYGLLTVVATVKGKRTNGTKFDQNLPLRVAV